MPLTMQMQISIISNSEGIENMKINISDMPNKSLSNIKSRHNIGIIKNLVARNEAGNKVKTCTLNASASTSMIKMPNNRLDNYIAVNTRNLNNH